MAISNPHNLRAPPPAARPFGIRVRLRPGDPFARLVGADWQRFHWFATERERDEALAAFDAEIDSNKAELETETSKREAVFVTLPAQLAGVYNRLAQRSRDGIAVAEVIKGGA